MKIEEARIQYNQQIKSYREQQVLLQQQKKELEQKINTTPDGKEVFANEAMEMPVPEVVEVQEIVEEQPIEEAPTTEVVEMPVPEVVEVQEIVEEQPVEEVSNWSACRSDYEGYWR